MGYYEQISEENRKYRQKRAAMHPLGRRLKDVASYIFIATGSVAIWVALLAPIWIWIIK